MSDKIWDKKIIWIGTIKVVGTTYLTDNEIKRIRRKCKSWFCAIQEKEMVEEYNGKNETVYYKSPVVRDLDEELGEFPTVEVIVRGG